MLYAHTKWGKGVSIEQIWCALHTNVFTVQSSLYAGSMIDELIAKHVVECSTIVTVDKWKPPA